MARKQPPPAPGSVSEEIREAVREGRELLKDLKVERQKIEALLNVGAHDMVDRAMARAVATLGASAKEAMDQSVKKIYLNFDRLEATLLGTTSRDRRSGEPSIPELIDLLARRREWLDLIEEAGDDPEKFRKMMAILAKEDACHLDDVGHCKAHAWYADDEKGEAQECPISVAKSMDQHGMLDPLYQGGIPVIWTEPFTQRR
jgi:hypothetical protein